MNDQSISISICFNKKNEIEILYEKLLTLFSKHSHIKPSDIVITSFSINDYIPYIHSTFNSLDIKNNIPFSISQKYSKKTELILSVFSNLLNLPNSRFENEDILELFDIPEIAKHFNISEEEISILYHWIEESNIRWAIDQKHKKNFSFPENKKNTWLYGIEKLLLSYAMNDEKNIWNNILACSVINGSRTDLIGKLILFINTLKKWKKKLSTLQNIKYWRSLSNDLIKDFFCTNERINDSIQLLQKNWTKMIDEILISNYPKKISIEILKKFFIYKYKYISGKKFSPGVVNFCHPYDICFIPFKIIYFIGADNQKIIPKSNHLDIFNLLNKYPLLGDDNLNYRNFYLFLQSIACAQEYFYISYVGYSVKDNSKIYPSILIDQLISYICSNFYLIGDENLNIKENTKKITTHLCTVYNKKYFFKKQRIYHSKKILKNTDIKIYDIKLFKKNCFNKINLIDFINFWKNPIRYFLKYYLKINLNFKKHKLNNTEPFLVHKTDIFKIKETILNKIIKNENIEKTFQYYMLSGKLPDNFFDTIFWKETVKEMHTIAKLVAEYRIFTEKKKIKINIEKYQINGMLSEIQKTGLLRWKPTKINYSDRITLWLEHLIYSVLGGIGESKIIGYKNQMWSFTCLDPKIAYNYLLYYIKGYIKGSKKPIFLIKSGASWLDQIYDINNHVIKNDKDSKTKGYKKLLETWTGNNYIQGEKEDFYIRKIITTLNIKNIKKICETAKMWLIPILKNKK